MTTKPLLPGYDEAIAKVLACAAEIGTEALPLDSAVGRVLRSDVTADRDQPPFDRSAMDGFAVRSIQVEANRPYEGAGTIAAGAPAEASHLAPATCSNIAVMRIATGAPVPDWADCVIPIEHAVVEQHGDTEQVTFTKTGDRHANVHHRASDTSTGDVVLRSGSRLAAHHMGIAAGVGAVELPVATRPRITLLTTGDEVVAAQTPAAQLQPQQIRNSNGPMLTALLGALDTPVISHEHVCDEPEQTLAAARQAVSQSHLVITCGGVSVGQRDLLPWAWQKLGLETVLHGVSIQPGKPVLVCRDEDKLVVGLPGNPVSVLATAHLFVWPIIRTMLGQTADLPWRPIELASAARAGSGRELFRAATLGDDGRAGVIKWHGSGDLMHTADADGFVRLPSQGPQIAAGQTVPFLPIIR